MEYAIATWTDITAHLVEATLALAHNGAVLCVFQPDVCVELGLERFEVYELDEHGVPIDVTIYAGDSWQNACLAMINRQ